MANVYVCARAYAIINTHTHSLTVTSDIFFIGTTCTFWARCWRETQHIVWMPSLALKNTMTNTKWMTDFSVAPMTQHQSSIKHFLDDSYWNGAVVQKQWDFCDGKIFTFGFHCSLVLYKSCGHLLGKMMPKVWLNTHIVSHLDDKLTKLLSAIQINNILWTDFILDFPKAALHCICNLKIRLCCFESNHGWNNSKRKALRPQLSDKVT